MSIMMPIDKRLRLAMQPVMPYEHIINAVSNWRIRAILGAGKWNTVPINEDWGGLVLNSEDFADICCSIYEGEWT